MSRSLARIFIIMLIAICGLAQTLHAEPVIKLPLDGYYRPGKFFPVSVTSDQPVNVRIDVEDGVSSRGSGTNLTLPVMLLSNTSRSLRVIIDGKPTDLPIRPLGENERLAIAGSSKLFARASSLFPGQLVVSAVVPMDRIGPLNEAYESADVVLWQGLDESAVFAKGFESISAGGPVLAVPGDEPATPWKNFQRRGGWSVIDLPTRGPTDSLDNPAAYDAMSGFSAGRSPESRRGVWLGTAVFAILALGATLLGRRGVYAIIAISILWLAGGAVYLARQTPISQQQASIIVRPGDGDITQVDSWLVRTSLQKQPDEFNAGTTLTRPVFAGHANLLEMWIEVTDAGWWYHYTLPRGGKAAFVSRRWRQNAAVPTVTVGPPKSSMGSDLARQFYSRAGDVTETVVDEFPDSDIVFVHPKR